MVGTCTLGPRHKGTMISSNRLIYAEYGLLEGVPGEKNRSQGSQHWEDLDALSIPQPIFTPIHPSIRQHRHLQSAGTFSVHQFCSQDPRVVIGHVYPTSAPSSAYNRLEEHKPISCKRLILESICLVAPLAPIQLHTTPVDPPITISDEVLPELLHRFLILSSRLRTMSCMSNYMQRTSNGEKETGVVL